MKRKNKTYRKSLFYFPLVAGSLLLPFMYSCSSKELMTKRLFMQSNTVGIEFPPNERGDAGVLAESVEYTNSDNNSETLTKEINSQYSLDRVNRLRAVEIVGKTNTTPERDGKVSVDFIVRVPKTLLSDNWRLTVSPVLLHNDSVVNLQDIVLKGSLFADKQKQDYKNYEEYVNSIVKKSDYDSVFLDKKRINKTIRNRQSFYWDRYHTQWRKVMNYKNWRFNKEERYAWFNQRQKGNRSELFHKHLRQADERVVRQLAMGNDTAGIYADEMRKFDKKADKLGKYWMRREIEDKKIPKKYREFYENNTQPEDIKNNVVTVADSIRIAENSYFFKEIAANEMKEERKREREKELVPYPYELNPRLDSVVTTKDEFLYHYKHEYPLTPGLRKLRLTLNGSINAVDRSGYTLQSSDTLSYFITSLAQLVDTSLIIKKTKLYRNMFDKQTIYPKFGTNRAQFEASFKDNRSQLDTVASKYRFYTETHGLHVDSIEFTATTALNGAWEDNLKLAENRSKSVKDYIVRVGLIPNADYIVKPNYRGEDWNTLARKIKENSQIVNKTEILQMLSAAIYPDDTEKEVRKRYRSDYKIISDSIYPQLNKIDIVYYLSRPNMVAADSMQFEVRDGYEEGLRLLQEREYWKAIDILAKYPDYNTALCLTCMGYNGKAYDLLVKLTPNEHTEYLMAILKSRLGKEEEAVGHLLKAIDLSPTKAYRATMDAEVLALVKKYNLYAELESAKNAYLSDDYEEKEAAKEEQAVEPDIAISGTEDLSKG